MVYVKPKKEDGAKAALRASDRVVATGRNLDKMRNVLGDVASENLTFVRLDIADEGQAKAAIEEGVKQFGRIDVVVNNAGYSLPGNFEEMTTPDIERQFATNLHGVMYVMRAVLPVMRNITVAFWPMGVLDDECAN
jgi:NAD(P)-dependent dehydrogenase (short-subunit alcohol dehydrogenase family)